VSWIIPLVIFTSDNGPHAELGHDHEFFDSNGVLRGLKRDTYEGGIRVPAIAVLERENQSRTVSDYQGCGQDFMPTFAELAGIEPPAQTNGVSFIPVLTGEKPKPREFFQLGVSQLRMEESNFSRPFGLEI
jgi:arylsulfatase A-like enzyme